MIYLFEHICLFTQKDLEMSLELVSRERYRKIERYKYDGEKIRSAIAYLLLRIGLYNELGYWGKPVIYQKENEKPKLEGMNKVEFNLSHCKRAVACAISQHKVGLDVQEPVSYNKGLGVMTLSEAELKHVESSENRDLEFTKLWTRKESFGKYWGFGIAYNLKAVDFLVGERKDRFQTFTRVFPEYVLTISSKEALGIRHISYSTLKMYINLFRSESENQWEGEKTDGGNEKKLSLQ
jgi:4'-phosphopantetheinyl transferase